MFRRVELALLSTLVVGCHTFGAFDAAGFHQTDLPYSVRYADPAKKLLVSDDWLIDNWEVSSVDGTPLSPKSGATELRQLDLQRNGKPLVTRVHAFDVKLVNRKSGGVIWSRALLLDPPHADLALRVLVENYASALADFGWYWVGIGGGQAQPVKVRTYATKITDSNELKVADRDAVVATIELAKVDQLKLDPASREAIVRVTLLRTGQAVKNVAGSGLSAFSSANPNAVASQLPVLLMVGYENNPTDFATQLPDYERFVSEVTIDPPTDVAIPDR